MEPGGSERERGNSRFRAGDWGGALRLYREGARARGGEGEGGEGGAPPPPPPEERALCHSNAAEALLRAADAGGLEAPGGGEGGAPAAAGGGEEVGVENGSEAGAQTRGARPAGESLEEPQDGPLSVGECLHEARGECDRALELDPRSVKALLRRCRAAEGLAGRDGEDGESAATAGAASRSAAQISALGRELELVEAAFKDAKAALELEPELQPAQAAVARLGARAEKLREETKAETLGKLKDLGNAVLGRFGMSLDNFKAVQDPATGSYSVSFQQ